MFDHLGIEGVEDLLTVIPDHLRSKTLDLPDPILGEHELRTHVTSLLDRNRSAVDLVSFLGSDCYRHYVPAVCDEINGRSEFLTAYSGSAYEDHGRYQALWEYTSMMGELLEMDVVSLPTYDGYQAAATSLRMASRLTGRKRALIAGSTSRAKQSKFSDYCRPALRLSAIDWAPSGELDMNHLVRELESDVAAVYVDQPNGLGVLDSQLGDISQMVHEVGALLVVGVDPILLGVIAPPGRLGADIVCGDVQALGMHPQFGGGHAGFIATADDPELIHEYPIRLYSLTPTSQPGEYGFGEVDPDRTSFVAREEGKEWLGTTANLWGITAGVYLALMGPVGMTELGGRLLGQASHLARRLDEIDGVTAPRFSGFHGKEFVVDFSESGKTVNEIHSHLEELGILGGADLSDVPGLGGCALYCTTEMHSLADLEMLTSAIEEVVTR
jgi:glycine dehydrogenase subunit 1